MNIWNSVWFAEHLLKKKQQHLSTLHCLLFSYYVFTMYNITIHFILTAMSFLDIHKEGIPDCHLIQFFFYQRLSVPRRTQLCICIHQIDMISHLLIGWARVYFNFWNMWIFIIFRWKVLPFVVSEIDNNKHEIQHPTSLIQNATLQLLRTLTICSSIQAESAQTEAVHTLCGLLRTIVNSGCSHGLSECTLFRSLCKI